MERPMPNLAVAITVFWTEVPCVGYLFRSWDPQNTHVLFSLRTVGALSETEHPLVVFFFFVLFLQVLRGRVAWQTNETCCCRTTMTDYLLPSRATVETYFVLRVPATMLIEATECWQDKLLALDRNEKGTGLDN
jgi:hypothetical protein